ncbi:MAG: HEAT repeat domain-containing protein, partial [Planctomycetota bacterium]
MKRTPLLLGLISALSLSFLSGPLLGQEPKPETLEEWALALKHRKRALRREAVDVLAESGQDAVPILVKALLGEHPWSRIYAARALGRIGKPAVPALVEVFPDCGQQSKILVLEAMKKTGPAVVEALPLLLTLLDKKTLDKMEGEDHWKAYTLRPAVQDALVAVGHPAFQSLLELYVKAEGEHRWDLRVLLTRIAEKDSSFFPEIEKRFVSSSPRERGILIEMICRMDPETEGLLPFLAEMVQARPHQEQILEALPRFGRRAVEHIVPLLRSEEREVYRLAFFALEELGPRAEAAIPDIIAIWLEESLIPFSLKAGHCHDLLPSLGRPAADELARLLPFAGPDNVDRMIRMLGRYGNNAVSAIPPLAKIASGPDEALARLARESLVKVCSTSDPASRTFVEHYLGLDGARRRRLDPIMEDLGGNPAAALPYWIECLRKGDAITRASAHLAVRSMGLEGDEAAPALVQVFRDRPPARRFSILMTLLEMRPPPELAVKCLVEALADPGPPGRQGTILQWIGRYGPLAADGVDAIGALLGSGNHSIRAAAARAIGEIGPNTSKAAPDLLRVLGEERPAAREHAAIALCKVSNGDALHIDALLMAEGWNDPLLRRCLV